ncbi:MAG TPA: hypothetical protein GXX63_02190 [Tissierellia bacterium]|nr:hypothetical protein [Tissierellia bacterium]
MILIQLYKVVDYIKGKYIVNLYKNIYDINPTPIKVSKYKFKNWRLDKLDKSELEGKKVQLHKLRNNRADTIKNTPSIINLSDEENNIMCIVYRQLQGNNYIIEKDVEIKSYSKVLIQRTVRNEDILDMYKLKRIRANKRIKEKYNLDTKGYPFLIVQNEAYNRSNRK